MTIIGNNMVRGKQANKRAVFSLLLYSGGLSRKQLAARLELTPSAITVLVSEMIKEGILKETRMLIREKAVGRKEIVVDIDEQHYYALGISINLDSIILSATTLRGSLLWMREEAFPEVGNVAQIVSQTAQWLLQEAQERNMDLHYAVGLGITVRGWVDSDSGVCINSMGLWDEKNAHLKAMYEEKIPLRVKLENNVRGLANAEMLLSGFGAKQGMLFIRSEVGIGGAIIINKELYTGHTYKAVEIGHVLVEPDGELCHCGRQGCLETIASNRSIERHAQSICNREDTPILFELSEKSGKIIDLEMALDAATLGEKAIRVYVDRALSKLAMVLRMTFDILDPEMVILYGKSFESDFYYQTLKKALFVDSGFEHLEKNTKKSKFNMQLDQTCAPLISIKDFFENGLDNENN